LPSQIGLVLIAAIVAAGGWFYLQRVLIAHQVSDAKIHDRPRGNLSDLYPRWLGARELLLHQRDPYSKDVSREIQAGYYGRPLDPSLPADPKDEQGFAYPVYVVLFLAPTIGLPFAIVQKAFFFLLVMLTSATVLLWVRILRWPAARSTQIGLVLLTLGSLATLQGLLLQQISLFVSGLLAIAILLFVTNHPVPAGILFAIATIKPQLIFLLLCWLVLWTFSDWRRRYPWLASFLATMTILFATSEWLLPHWIPSFYHAIRDYQKYTGNVSILDALLTKPWSSILEFIALSATVIACWRERHQPANSKTFAAILCLVLAVTVLLIPSASTYNQVFLIPALLLVAKERHSIWEKSPASRTLFALIAVLLCWPWISSLVLAALSLLLTPASFNRTWAIPTWTLSSIPVAVSALMLLTYYHLTFNAPPTPPSS